MRINKCAVERRECAREMKGCGHSLSRRSTQIERTRGGERGERALNLPPAERGRHDDNNKRDGKRVI